MGLSRLWAVTAIWLELQVAVVHLHFDDWRECNLSSKLLNIFLETR